MVEKLIDFMRKKEEKWLPRNLFLLLGGENIIRTGFLILNLFEIMVIPEILQEEGL